MPRAKKRKTRPPKRVPVARTPDALAEHFAEVISALGVDEHTPEGARTYAIVGGKIRALLDSYLHARACATQSPAFVREQLGPLAKSCEDLAGKLDDLASETAWALECDLVQIGGDYHKGPAWLRETDMVELKRILGRLGHAIDLAQSRVNEIDTTKPRRDSRRGILLLQLCELFRQHFVPCESDTSPADARAEFVRGVLVLAGIPCPNDPAKGHARVVAMLERYPL